MNDILFSADKEDEVEVGEPPSVLAETNAEVETSWFPTLYKVLKVLCSESFICLEIN